MRYIYTPHSWPSCEYTVEDGKDGRGWEWAGTAIMQHFFDDGEMKIVDPPAEDVILTVTFAARKWLVSIFQDGSWDIKMCTDKKE